MFPFSRILPAAAAVTQVVPRARPRHHDTAARSDRRVTSSANLSARPISAMGAALPIARDPPEREEPWRRRLTGAELILGLALRGLALPVGL